MIRTLSKAALVAIVGIAGFSASQADAAGATGNASLTVAAPLTITETTALTFGSVTVGSTGGTIVVTAGGATSYTGDVASFGGTSGTAALFTLGGEGGASYTVSAMTSALGLTGPGTAMPLGTFTNNAGGTLGGAGSDTFNVGATLTVNADQAAGSYTGTYTFTVDYQ